MNERIQALYKKAHEDGYLNKTFNPEKFAELIIKECASKVTCNEALNIFEHFGVEE